MERFGQPNNDPLAAKCRTPQFSSIQHNHSNLFNPQQTNPSDNISNELRSSSTKHIKVVSTSLPSSPQIDNSHLPQTNNQLRASSNARNKLWFQDGKVVVQDEEQNRGALSSCHSRNPDQCAYNCNGLGHIARECPRPKRLQDSDYFKDKMLLMQAQESGAVLDEEQSLFLAGEQLMNVTDSKLIYDEAGTSYDSNTPSEVHDHDTFVNHLDEYHEVHEMQTDEQHNYVVDSYTDYTSNSNTIPYDQYMEDNEDHVVQRDVSSVRKMH
ncbi:retrovirus-related pol polyprotein from transposon TNT 1-94 [Tanacetum coccineum]